MDYFKHYSTASDSKLINHLFDEYRHTGYAYWFLLLELCSENWDGKGDPKFKFHTRIVRQKLRISHTKLEHFLTKCSTFSDILFQLSENELEIEVPKLAEVKTSRSVIKSNKKQLTVYIDKEKDIDKEAKSETKKSRASKKPTTPLFEVEPLQLEEDLNADQTAITILTLLNSVCFRVFRPTDFNLKFINARLKEKYTLEDFKKVIEYKNKEWSAKPEMKEYLQPSTLFGNKFDQYLNQALGSETISQAEEDALIARFFPGA